MPRSDWDPEQYRRFSAERSAPFWDLVDLVEPDGLDAMADLGCGDGELTAAAADRLGVARAVGIDSSPNMLERASAHRSDSVDFEAGDIADWPTVSADRDRPRDATVTGSGRFDLVLANASLQWVPDHPAVITRWAGALGARGQLAVQVPANGDHPSHLVADEVASSEPFLSAMGGSAPPNPTAVNVLPPDAYARLLYDLGFERQHVRLVVYPHVLGSSSDVVEWVRGTNLTRFFNVLPTELHEPFVDAYRTALLARIGEQRPYLYTFKRILMWARLDRDPS